MPHSSLRGQVVTSLRDLWLPVTVQIAWTLVKRGYTVTPQLLADAREHLLRGVDRSLPIDQVEWLAAAWTDDYLARRVEGAYRPPPPEGPEVRVPAEAWRDGILEAADRGMQAAFRFIYAEGLSPAKAARHLRCSERTLTAARERLRDCTRTWLSGAPAWTGGLDVDTIDTLLERLATLAARGAPGPLGLMSPAGLAHAETCPRTSRAVRLIRRGHLTAQALFPPADEADPGRGETAVVCVVLHPDAHRHAAGLGRLLSGHGVLVGTATWLLPAESETLLYEGLVGLCTQGRPARHHVRATRVTGSGRWAGDTLLGPVAVDAIDATRAAPWGDICSRPALPMPAPPPPSAHRWWAAAIALAAATVALGVAVAQPERTHSPTPIDAQFLHTPDGWEVTFDVPDQAVVDVVSVEGDELRILHRSLRSARGAWATGYGTFRARLPGDTVALIASPRGIDDLERLALDAVQHPDPLRALEQMIHRSSPRADLARSASVVADAGLAGPVASPL